MKRRFPTLWGVIRRTAKQTDQRVVILIDEYDKPMLQALDNDELQEIYRDILKFLRCTEKHGWGYQIYFFTDVTKMF